MKKWFENLSSKAKKLLFAGTGIVLALLLILMLWPRNSERTIAVGNLLSDGDFSEYASKGSSAWYEDAYVNRASYTQFEVFMDEDGQPTAHIMNMLANDARFAQIVTVSPNSLYCLEGDIRAKATGGLGANLSVEGPYVFSEPLYDQDEWQHVKLYGRTNSDQHTVTVFVRLGGYSGEATGEAWFRNISLTEVEEVPEGYWARDWFQASNAYYDDTDDTDDTVGDAGPAAHIALMILAILVYAALVYHTLRKTNRVRILENGQFYVFCLFAAGIVLRLILALTIHGYDVDVTDFCSWASGVAVNGPGAFYRLDLDPVVRSQMFICDYPPGYILILGVMGLLGQWFETGVTELMIKIPPILADLGSAWIIFKWFMSRSTSSNKKHTGVYTPFTLCMLALLLFNPLILLTSAGWGQSDSVMMFFLLLTLWFGLKKQWSFALPFYVIAVLMKPQALMFGPLGLAALYLQYRGINGDQSQKRDMLREFCIGIVAMLAAAAAIVLPFAGNHGFQWLFDLYGKTMSYYAYATVNACNLYFLAGANWSDLVSEAPRWFGTLAAIVTGAPALWILIRRKKPKMPELLPLVMILAGAGSLMLLAWIVPLTWSFWSTALMAFMIALALLLLILSGELRHLPLYGGFLMMALFTLGGMMHERYLFPAIPLLLWAWLIEKDDRILVVAFLATAGAFLNAGCVLSRNQRIGGSGGHLTIPIIGHISDMSVLEYLSAVLNCCAFAFLEYLAVMRLTETGEWHFKTLVSPARRDAEPTAKSERRVSLGEHILADELGERSQKNRFDKKDLLIILTVTVLYALLAFYHLGSTVSPQNGYEFHAKYIENPDYRAELNDDADQTLTEEEAEPYILQTESVTFDLGQQISDFRMLYMGGVHQYDCSFLVETSADGENWEQSYDCAMEEGGLFQWMYVRSYRGTSGLGLNGRYVRLTPDSAGLTLMEVLFRDTAGNVLPVASAVSSMEYDVSALVDEQGTLTGEPGWYNSMYFDEIYHARTGYEHYMGMTPYETTHPPLGKVLISWCIALFGMTPFGWRFAGTMAGVLMLPGIYLTARLLFKKRRYAVLCILMLALDTMHYTQTRLATIDSFVVLFIIWSYYFMYRWILDDFFGKPILRTTVSLALSGIMMGLAVASKWTGCYAGVGLAILFFISVGRRIYVIRKVRKNDYRKTSERIKTAQAGMGNLLAVVASCLIWFVAIPAGIYYLSYIPYFAPNGGVSLQRIVNASIGMFSYHSQPGFGMDHPYYSPWYEWPFAMAKPMWYAADRYEPAGYASSIFAFGNISVWWVGLAAVLVIAAAYLLKQLRAYFNGFASEKPGPLSPKGGYDRRPLLLLISFGLQFVPWTLVPRGTYIYHYFPSVPFIILLAGLMFEYLGDWFTERAVARNQTASDAEAVRRKADRLCIILLAVYLLIVAALFIAFFPYASGLTVRTGWLNAMNWFGNLLY